MEKWFLVVFLFIPLILFSNNGDGSPGDSNIQYLGRWDKSNSQAYRSYWGGAYLKARFSGKTVQLNLGKAVNIYVNIDNTGFKLYQAEPGILNLTPESLDDQVHQLMIVASYANDEILFKGLILDKGATTLAQPQKEIIEFIGNSITSGQQTTHKNLSAYSWITGENLEVDHTQISYPGITLTDGYHYTGDWAPKRGQKFQYFSTKSPGHQDCPKWDFSQYTPKIIVINLGTNDHNLKVPNSVFEETYYQFLKNIRDEFPETFIVAMGTLGGYYIEETRNAVVRFSESLDSRIQFIDSTGWLLPSQDFVDTNHPNDQGHLKIAIKLAPILKEYLGKN
ncbi:MAG: hypothetical protein COA80_19180 [Leeuwenhoekiella sp.]|nr:MAG: hypothetical protein COA80_19180 [Leeuwenhoekiella sp.]